MWGQSRLSNHPFVHAVSQGPTRLQQILEGKKPHRPTLQKAAAVTGADGIPSAARNSSRQKLAAALEVNASLGKVPATLLQSAAEACEGTCYEVRHNVLLPPFSQISTSSLVKKGSC